MARKKRRVRDKVSGKKLRRKKGSDGSLPAAELLAVSNPSERQRLKVNPHASKKSQQKQKSRIRKMKNRGSPIKRAKIPDSLKKKVFYGTASSNSFGIPRVVKMHSTRFVFERCWKVSDPRGPFDRFCDNLIKRRRAPNIKRLYHGTVPHNIPGICAESMMTSENYGMLGAGAYFTPYYEKAFGFVGGNEKAFIVVADVALGVCRTVDRGVMLDLEQARQEGFDSTRAIGGAFNMYSRKLTWTEYCVYDPNQIQIVSVLQFRRELLP